MNIASFIDERLDLMLAHPEHWGDAEAFESQILLLLEIQEVMRAETDVSSQTSLRQLLDGYVAFLRPLFPDLGPRPLSSVVEDQRVIASALEQFRARLGVRDRQRSPGNSEAPPPAPVELGSDVVVDDDDTKAVMPRKAAA